VRPIPTRSRTGVLLLAAALSAWSCKESTAPGRYAAQSVTAGTQHSCSLTTSGAGHCWGWNVYGQLGLGGTDSAAHATPASVSGGLTFAVMSAGGYHTCGVTAGGAAYCWGDGVHGQLGNGSTANDSAPSAVSGALAFSAVSAGLYHTCGLVSGGAARCWGYNVAGALGVGTSDTAPHAMPAAVSGGLTFTAVSAGGYHTCGLTAAGAAYCWGDNTYGQTIVPPDLTNVVAVAGGG